MEKKRQPKAIHRDKSKIQGNNAGNKTPATIWINVRGTRKQGDLDGKVSTILDCLVDERIIPDDSVKILNRTITTFEKTKTAGIDIVIIEEK